MNQNAPSFSGKLRRATNAGKYEDNQELLLEDDKTEETQNLIDLSENEKSDFTRCSLGGASGSLDTERFLAVTASDYSIWMMDEYHL